MAVEFEDFSVNVKAALDDAAIAYLYEVAELVKGETVRNTRPSEDWEPNVRKSWGYIVDEAKGEAKIGSPIEAVYWEEFGTGEHALYKNGRKGWWVYVEGQNTPRANQKYYTEDEAKAVAASMRASGLPAHATNGKTPNRPLYRAFTSLRSAIVKRAEDVFGREMK